MKLAANFVNSLIFSRTSWPRFLAALFLGAITTLALPPFNHQLILLVTLPAFLILIISEEKIKKAFWTGWAFGFGHFVTGLYWISISLLVEPEKFAWLIPFAVSLVPAFLSIYIGIVSVIIKIFSFRSWILLIFFASVWTGAEILRGALFTGFPWNLIGYTWTDNLEILQITSIIGIYGLSFLTVFLFCIPVLMLNFRKFNEEKQVSFNLVPVPIVIGGIIIALMWRWGDYRLNNAAGNLSDINVHLIQANIKQDMKWDDKKRFDNFIKHLEMSKEAVAKQPESETNYFVWSETSIPYVLEKNKELLMLIDDYLPDNSYVFTGALRVSDGVDGDINGKGIWNSLYVIGGDGEILNHYDKSLLVPFGEFVPFRNILPSFVKKITHGMGDFSSGDGAKSIEIEGVETFSPYICYEIIFPSYFIDNANRPTWLLNITNDAWFGNSTGPYQHKEIARVRSVELGIPLARTANTGISIVTDAHGRELDSIKLNEEGVISTKLPKDIEPTVYSKARFLSHYMIFAVILILVLMKIVVRVTRR